MKRFFSILVGVLSLCYTASAQTNSTYVNSTSYHDAETGVTFQSVTTPEGISYRLALPANASSSQPFDILLQVVAPISMGWVGWAWAGHMTYNPLTVLWANGNKVTSSSRHATAHVMPDVYDGATYTTLKGSEANETHYKLTALCKGCSAWTDTDGEKASLNGAGLATFAYAWSTTAPVDPADSGSMFSKHDAHGQWTHDLAKARSVRFGYWVASNTLPAPGGQCPSKRRG